MSTRDPLDRESWGNDEASQKGWSPELRLAVSQTASRLGALACNSKPDHTRRHRELTANGLTVVTHAYLLMHDVDGGPGTT
jgi:hypothetical protein